MSRHDLKSSEITPEGVYLNRRTFLAAVGVLGAGLVGSRALAARSASDLMPQQGQDPLGKPYGLQEYDRPTSYEDVTSYNNFYEFGTGKTDPVELSGNFQPKPWSLRVHGECEHPGDYDLEDFLSPNQLEERIYRLRCVEAWSMVVPWVGVPLAPILERFAPTSRAKYVAFRTVFRPREMPGQNYGFIDWPYVEGLRIDEAMHPLTMFAVGIYGRVLPNQNGAPIRLVVPWKYGFKSIKSIISVGFTEEEPPATWNIQAPQEYGFYANVNPEVDHPRWSQRRERRIGELLRRDTLMFNGYADEVAHLYEGMDLRRLY